ncbi:MAG: DUF2062 domain-containing protein [Desulfobacteraceae bacterium]|nr:DUF2062 domain-containing protein [Desulfobacteraceae bacterium]
MGAFWHLFTPLAILNRKLVIPILNLLKQGITPEKLAFTVAAGTILGLFPVAGSPTVLCIIAAFVFRLNQVVIQIVNCVVYPLWFVLLLPFYKMGGYIFQASPMPLPASQIVSMFQADMWGFIQALGTATLHAVGAWILICPSVAVCIYIFLIPVFRKYAAYQR